MSITPKLTRLFIATAPDGTKFARQTFGKVYLYVSVIRDGEDEWRVGWHTSEKNAAKSAAEWKKWYPERDVYLLTPTQTLVRWI
jgi:hypothetical protein